MEEEELVHRMSHLKKKPEFNLLNIRYLLWSQHRCGTLSKSILTILELWKFLTEEVSRALSIKKDRQYGSGWCSDVLFNEKDLD